MIGEILPEQVRSVETFGDHDNVHLFAEERLVISNAVEKRSREFATVRYCARRALTSLGFSPAPIVPGERGAPTWPYGVVGSMTHCHGYRAAALGHASELLAVGIDAEPNEPLPLGLLHTVALPEERERLPGEAGVHWDRLLFSAKEAVYKAWFPHTRRWLGFEDASVQFDPMHGTFTAQLLVPGPAVLGNVHNRLHGRWLCRHGLLLASVSVVTEQHAATKISWRSTTTPEATEPSTASAPGIEQQEGRL